VRKRWLIGLRGSAPHAIPRSLSMPSKYPISSSRKYSPGARLGRPILSAWKQAHCRSTHASKPRASSNRSDCSRKDAPRSVATPCVPPTNLLASPAACACPSPCLKSTNKTCGYPRTFRSRIQDFHHRLVGKLGGVQAGRRIPCSVETASPSRLLISTFRIARCS